MKVYEHLDVSTEAAVEESPAPEWLSGQRYAVEFFASLLRPRKVERNLTAPVSIQDRMDALNDLFVTRDRYQSLVASYPAACFVLGWLVARIAEVRSLARPELGRLARVGPATT